ncbi:hypothetical protein ANN_15045 [Periplaneta americana]|uniref:Uncharacterized protein n=1 Tax=Periplaneta americana TaxID=6978 RepID=A0ABQ8SYL3_PERAM|nr:hypothetical protein ANN_15045 [Periplaneta americana]
MAVDIGHIRQHICLTWSQATKGNIEGGGFGPVLWIEFGVAQWSERLEEDSDESSDVRRRSSDNSDIESRAASSSSSLRHTTSESEKKPDSTVSSERNKTMRNGINDNVRVNKKTPSTSSLFDVKDLCQNKVDNHGEKRQWKEGSLTGSKTNLENSPLKKLKLNFASSSDTSEKRTDSDSDVRNQTDLLLRLGGDASSGSPRKVVLSYQKTIYVIFSKLRETVNTKNVLKCLSLKLKVGREPSKCLTREASHPTCRNLPRNFGDITDVLREDHVQNISCLFPLQGPKIEAGILLRPDDNAAQLDIPASLASGVECACEMEYTLSRPIFSMKYKQETEVTGIE